MALPNTKVEIAFNAGYTTPAASRTWTDVSTYVEGAQVLGITRGRADEVSAMQPSRLALTLNNRDGRFTPRLASGAYYPNVKKGRPVRITLGANMLSAINSSFESGAGTWAFNTLLGARDLGTSLAQSAVRATDGTKSLLATWSTTAIGNFAGVNVTTIIGQVYTLSADVYVPTGSPNVRLSAAFVANGAFVTTKDAWVRTSVTFTATSTSSFVGLECLSATAGQTCYLDSAMVDTGSTLMPFTLGGTDRVRYTGYASEWPVSWPDGTSADAVVSLTAMSRMSRMGRGAELRSVIEEEIALDTPAAYYTLGEPVGATSAVDSSGNQTSALAMAGTGTDVVFGNATGPGTDGLTAAEFAAGKYLRPTGGTFSTPSATEYTLSLFFNTSTVSCGLLFGGMAVQAGVAFNGTGKLTHATFTSATTYTDGAWHHLALVYTGGVTTIYVDGTSIGSHADVVDGGASTTTFDIGWNGVTAFTGSIAHAALWSRDLAASEVLSVADAGLNGFAGELSGARITRLAGYAGIPTAEISADTGSSTIGHFDITGMTPIAAMQKVTETENGMLYDAKDGTLTSKGRSARYTVASSFTLDVTAQEVEADLEPTDDDQFVVNEVTATANGNPAGLALDQTSIDDQGYYRAGLDTVTDDLDDALQGANWKVAKGADPDPRYTTVTVDVTNSSTTLAAAVLAAEIGTRFTLINLPSQAPGSSVDLFVEGSAEQITAARHTITFNTSPAAGYDVWTIEDAVFGQYDAYPISY